MSIRKCYIRNQMGHIQRTRNKLKIKRGWCCCCLAQFLQIHADSTFPVHSTFLLVNKKPRELKLHWNLKYLILRCYFPRTFKLQNSKTHLNFQDNVESMNYNETIQHILPISFLYIYNMFFSQNLLRLSLLE